MFDENKFNEFCNELNIFLGMHHELYENICKDVYLEELTSKVFKSIGLDSDWKPDFSHSVGKDQSINKKGISNKSGMILLDKNNELKIKISGSRTSKYETLGAKLNFLQNNNYDYILGCGTNKTEIESGLKKYYCYVIDSEKFNFFDWDWQEDEDKKGDKKWYASYENIEAVIQSRSTSNQLWLTVSKDFCDFFQIIDVEY